jgi:hypothetical protein
MAEQQREITLRDVSTGYFDEAKTWWIVGLVCKLASPVLGAALVVWNLLPPATPLIVLALASVAELCIWRSDILKGSGESWLRKLDLYDSFDWKIPAEEEAGAIGDLSRRQHRSFRAKALARDYFASTEPPGSRRALENAKESAWWTRRLAKQMGYLCLGATAIALIGTVAALLITMQTVQNLALLPSIGRFAIAVLLAILSVGVLRLTVSYYGFATKAEATENQAKSRLDAGILDDVTAIRIWQEYHLARAAAPMLPTGLWQRHRPNWNAIWKRFLSPRSNEGDQNP